MTHIRFNSRCMKYSSTVYLNNVWTLLTLFKRIVEMDWKVQKKIVQRLTFHGVVLCNIIYVMKSISK